MKLEDVRGIAKLHSIKPGKLSKTELIKTIQINEGNFDCFSAPKDSRCDQMDCLWREDCFDVAQKGELTGN